MEGRLNVVLAAALVLSLLLVSPAAGMECVQCNSVSSLECVSSPPAPKACPSEMKYCITVKETRVEDDYLTLLTRACVPVDLGLKCMDHQSSPNGESINVCREVCQSSGCNNEPYKGDEDHESGAAQLSTPLSCLLITWVLMLMRWAAA
ncbi:uncharacterized protein LOC135947802 [Cloeon dipterum]|uniref:uncharacterized protein LOC135947802 n=1 Tax=Cloeon dipterum TaxID=197152 RepID=UPI00321FF7A5